MSDDQFTRLFKYIETMRREMQEEFARVHAEFRQVYGILDKTAKDQETCEQERLAMNHQINRHDNWIQQVAEQTNTKLK